MKKHFLSVVIPFVLFSTSAHADLVVDKGATPTPLAATSARTSASPNSGADSLSWRNWSSAPLVAFDPQSQQYQSSPQQDAYRTYPTERYQEGQYPVASDAQSTHTVVTSRVITEQPVMIAQSSGSSSSSSQSLTESGRPSSGVQSAGWANDMPISLALRQIVPSDFKLRENDVLSSVFVSWTGDRAWPVVLGELASRNNFVAHIDWNRREVSLAPAMMRASRQAAPVAKAMPSMMSEQRQDQVIIVSNDTSRSGAISSGPYSKDSYSKDSYSKDNTHSKDGAYRPTIIKTGSVQVSSAAINTGAWVLDPKYTLKENIQAWGERAGWRVVWEGADYPIVASATFTGDFASPAGPVAKLIAAYETSDQPLTANLTTLDRVLYVKNKYYNQEQVVPTSPGEMSPDLFGKKD